MADAPSQLDLFDYKPKLEDYFDKDLPDSVRDGPADHDDDQRPEAVSGRAVDLQVQAARQDGSLGQRAAAAHRRASSTTCALVKIDAHRGDQPRPGDHLHSDRQPDSGPAEPGRVALLRPRQPEPGPAGVRRAALATCAAGCAAAGSLLAAVGLRLPAHRAPGVALRSQRRSGALPVEPAGRRCRHAAARCSTASAELNAETVR